MTIINDYNTLTEDEKTVIGIITELQKRDTDPKTNEITISENLKITLTGEGIKKLRMISEKNVDSDSAINSLILKNLIVNNGTELKLTKIGIEVGKVIHSEQMSEWYNTNLTRCAESEAYGLFCEKVFGKNLRQFNVLDMDQLETLISSLKLNSTDLVLDLGCGLGKIAEYIQKKTGATITGIDFADQLIQWAKSHTNISGNGLKFQVGDINDISFPAASFTAIYAIDTLYSTNVDDLGLAIAKLNEVLAANGRLGIFFAQIIESKEYRYILEPDQTEMAQALKNNNFFYSVIDFTQNARDIWEREISIGNELREMFEKEGNLELCEDRIADGKRCIYRIDNHLQKRYFYYASKI